MQAMKFFIDTHDVSTNTFPAGLTPQQFEGFFAGYERACYNEGVIPLRVHVGYGDGRAFCFTMHRMPSRCAVPMPQPDCPSTTSPK